MVFRSKIDAYFVKFISIILVILGIAVLFPLFVDDKLSFVEISALLSILIVVIAFILWPIFTTKYVFKQQHLVVKGGFFRSRIPYEEITRVNQTTDIFTGYRILTSKDAIEIFYQSGVFGSVKISPADKQLFITELKKRCPRATIRLEK
ncbi:PH domain-containing protein [Gracilibacillus sp. S3-1-1]|uniref:PH domain-containing protein n=1 Tax=Gracilibacillus pellucidus TaxID=3095368 RepID=A0ACC6M0B5_9BACI|nr:PH domain-containing protein [Gracilibacillus sp. S3-1-1]MDX8044376.1 PH domain-containing protein [Gracilibacillus sp. S3-1-1]